MKVSEFWIYVVIVCAIAFCWVFDDWCDSQIEIEKQKAQQTYYQSFGKVVEKLTDKTDPIEEIIKQEKQK